MEKWIFIGEDVEVELSGPEGIPSHIIWRGKKYRILNIVATWQRLDLQRRWWKRRHRDYFLIEVENGKMWEIYRHRGPGDRFWRLVREKS